MPEVSDLYITLRAEASPFMRGMRQASEEGESFTTRMGGLRNAMVKVGAATTAVGVGFVAYGVKAAGDFQQQMNLLVTACGESTSKLKMVSDGVLSMARETGTSTEMLADGMYNVEKAGYRAGDGLKILRAAAQGAREEGAPLNDVVGAMTTVMKNFHIPAWKSAQVMNAMKTAAGEAKATFAEFSTALPTVLPAAYAAGVSFQDVAGTLATMTQRGETARHAAQLMTGTLRQLQSPTSTTVSALNQVGLTSQKVALDLGKKGLSGTLEEIVTAIQTKMGPSGLYAAGVFKQSAQASESLQAMLSKMPGSLKQAAQAFLDGKMSASDFRQEFKGLGADGYAQGSQFMALTAKAKGFSDGVKSGNGPLTTFSDLLRRTTGGQMGLQTALLTTGKNAADTRANVAKVGKSFNDASKDVEGWKITQKSFNVQMSRLKETVTTAAITIGLKLLPVIQRGIDFFAKHQTATEALATAIGVVLAAAVVSFATSAVTGAVSGLKDFAKGLAAAGRAVKAFALSERLAAVAAKVMAVGQAVLNAVLDANPIILIVIAVAALVAGLIYAYYHCETFRRIVQAAFEGVKIAAIAVWHALLAAWDGVVIGVQWLWHAIQGVWNSIAAVTSSVWNGIVGFFKKWWPLLLFIFALPIAVLLSIWNHFHAAIMSVVHAVWNAVAGFFKTVWDGIKASAAFVWGLIRVSIVDPIMATWKTIVSVWETVHRWLSTMWAGIRRVASDQWARIKSSMIDPIIGAWHKITSTIGDIKRAISDGLENAWNKVKGIGGRFLSIGKSIVMGIVHGIENASGALFDSLKGLADNALKSAKDVLGINSPSKVFAEHVGVAIPEGIAKGVTDNAHLARAAVTAMSGQLAGNRMTFGGALHGRGPALAGNRGGGSHVTNIHVHVAGHVLTERQLVDAVQEGMLRRGMRNPLTYPVYGR